jgi:hypothetical protein
MSTLWPSTPLDAAQRAFELLCCPPAPLAFDGRGFPGLPDRILPLDELRAVLVSAAAARPVRDAVWRELVTRARRDGPAWVLAAVGVAMPGLRRCAGRAARGWRGDSSDLDAELIAGFVARLATVDLDGPRVCGRLLDAGERAARRACGRAEEAEALRVEGAWSLPPHQPWDHPDWVLARAVAAAVITPEECLLISATRLDEAPLRSVADQLGLSVQLAGAWRRAAERRLAGAIAEGELEWVPLAPRADQAATRRPRADGSRLGVTDRAGWEQVGQPRRRGRRVRRPNRGLGWARNRGSRPQRAAGDRRSRADRRGGTRASRARAVFTPVDRTPRKELAPTASGPRAGQRPGARCQQRLPRLPGGPEVSWPCATCPYPPTSPPPPQRRSTTCPL